MRVSPTRDDSLHRVLDTIWPARCVFPHQPEGVTVEFTKIG